MTKEEQKRIRAMTTKCIKAGSTYSVNKVKTIIKLLDALEKAEAQVELMNNLIASAKPISKTIENFCCDEMFQKNEICCNLEGRYPTAMCEKCPLYLFKISVSKESSDNEQG